MNLILCRGIQGSGKTTYAKRYCIEHKNTIRINRDDIRKMFSQKWSAELEDIVKTVEYNAMVSALCSGKDVIIDDVSNLSSDTIKNIMSYIHVMNFNVNVIMKDFFIPLEECILRDSLRSSPIGETIIKNTYKKYKDIING
jgi:predicted kinase